MEGARQIGFTVVSISISLIAAFIPLLFMTGTVGRVFREFAVTLAFAIAISMVASLTLTPMICAHFVRKPPSRDATWFDRMVERTMAWMVGLYGRSLRVVLQHRALTMLVLVGTIALTGALYIKANKGWFPFDDSGLIWGSVRRPRPEISFQAMVELTAAGDRHRAGRSRRRRRRHRRSARRRYNASANRGHALHQPQAVLGAPRNRMGRGQPPAPAAQCHSRPARRSCSRRRTCAPAGAGGDASYQYTIWTPDYQELLAWAPVIYDQHAEGAGNRRRLRRPPAGRLAGQRRRRPARGVAARRAHAGHPEPRSTTRSRSGRSRRSTPSATIIA